MGFVCKYPAPVVGVNEDVAVDARAEERKKNVELAVWTGASIQLPRFDPSVHLN
jgi:hypothetical protein